MQLLTSISIFRYFFKVTWDLFFFMTRTPNFFSEFPSAIWNKRGSREISPILKRSFGDLTQISEYRLFQWLGRPLCILGILLLFFSIRQNKIRTKPVVSPHKMNADSYNKYSIRFPTRSSVPLNYESVARTARHRSILCVFYTADRRFDSLWRRCLSALDSEPQSGSKPDNGISPSIRLRFVPNLWVFKGMAKNEC